MSRYIPQTTFGDIYKHFWISNFNTVSEWVDKCNRKMFSTAEIRILWSKTYAPKNNEGVTLMLDGHDTRIAWNDPADVRKWKNGELYSFKHKSAGKLIKILLTIRYKNSNIDRCAALWNRALKISAMCRKRGSK